MSKKKVAIEGGHGINTAGKRTPDGEREWSFNNKVVLAAIKELLTYEDVEVLRLDDPTGKRDVPLKERTDKANKWGADILMSVHHNADKGVWSSKHGGTETFVYTTNPKGSRELATIVQRELVKAYGLANRGVKMKDLHMLRESKMTAILTEGGFMDSTIDIIKMRDDKVLEAAGKAHAIGAAEFLKLKKKPVKVTTPPKASQPSTGAYVVHSNINGYVNAANAKSRTKAASSVKPGSYHIYKQADGMFNVTTKVGVPGSWINPADNKAPAPKAPKTFLIKVKVKELWYYDKPDWSARRSTVRLNDVFTVVDTLTVNGSKMYKLKSGTYITANTQYVEVLK